MSDVKYDDVKKLIENFQDLHKNMHYLLNEKTKQFYLSASQIRLLMIVKKHQNINQNALAKKLNVTKATLSVRLQRLEKMGYLTKKQDIHEIGRAHVYGNVIIFNVISNFIFICSHNF